MFWLGRSSGTPRRWTVAEPIIKPHESPDVCRAPLPGKPELPCGRSFGHKGSHIHYGDNGATGWGSADTDGEKE